MESAGSEEANSTDTDEGPDDGPMVPDLPDAMYGLLRPENHANYDLREQVLYIVNHLND